MEAFLVSTGIVALGEMGDKTQLLAIVLAARYKRPVPIIVAVLLATLLNHALAALVGQGIAELLTPDVLRWVVIGSFLLMAIWMLIPDKVDDTHVAKSRNGIFYTTFVAFFIAEMGDKTQVATIALAAHYESLVMVVLGSTLGMMIANVPAVLMGEAISRRIPMRVMNGLAAAIFVVLALI